jgi:hypothetical protein
MRKIGASIRLSVRMAPCRDVVTGRVKERPEADLVLTSGHTPSSFRHASGIMTASATTVLYWSLLSIERIYFISALS